MGGGGRTGARAGGGGERVEPELGEPELAEPELAEPELAGHDLAEHDLAEPELAGHGLAELEFAVIDLETTGWSSGGAGDGARESPPHWSTRASRCRPASRT